MLVDREKLGNKTKFHHLKPLAYAIVLAANCAFIAPSQAANYLVINTNDSGIGSLRSAIQAANANTGPDTIVFSTAPGSTINLQSRLFISDAVTITGPTAGNKKSLIIDANENTQIISAKTLSVGDTLTIENITLTNGRINLNNSKGGAIDANNGNIVLNHTAITNNRSLTGGGGISLFGSESSLTLNHSTVSGNSTTSSSFGRGGGIYVQNSEVNINDSKITNNSTVGSPASGGGISSISGEITITNSLILGNSTLGDTSGGGAISISNADLGIYDSSISNNFTSGENSPGGGIDQSYGGTILLNSTLADNKTMGSTSDGGGIRLMRVDSLLLSQSTVSGNSIANSNSYGGGLYIRADDALILQSTITENVSANSSHGISMNNFSANISLINAILAGNGSGNQNFLNRFSTGTGLLNVSHSLFGDPVSEINGSNVNSYSSFGNPSINLSLGALQHNGSTLKTHLPNFDSFIFDRGVISFLTLPEDQRGTGFPRIVNIDVDMGAVERQANINTNPNEVLTRHDMAREILKAKLGANYKPPLASGTLYDDVAIGDINANWIEKLSEDNVSEGCASNKFCPDMLVSRESLAKIFLKVKNGFDFVPSSSSNLFTDVPVGSFNAEWINELSDNTEYTIGCDANKFCPKEPVTREWFNTLLSQLP